MDFKIISEDLEIVRMLVSQWSKKYNINHLEHTLVMDKLRAIADSLESGVPSAVEVPAAEGGDMPVIQAPDEKEAGPADIDTDPGAEDGELPTMSNIEREIILHENGELPSDLEDADMEEFGRYRSDRDALRSLYYDDGPAVRITDEKAIEETVNECVGEAVASEEPSAAAGRAGGMENEPVDRVSRTDGQPKPVLGDVINAGTHIIGESFGHQGNDIVSNITGSVGLRKSIGINDRYLLIRDLFRGDAALYDKSIETLDGFTDLNDAMLYVHDNFHWEPDSEGAKLLVELLVNKLS